MAHKLAVLFYRMLRYGQEYVDRGQQFYQDKYRQQEIAFLNRKAAQLGMIVTQPGGFRVTQSPEKRPSHIQQPTDEFLESIGKLVDLTVLSDL